jgi:hypothetical protein
VRKRARNEKGVWLDVPNSTVDQITEGLKADKRPGIEVSGGLGSVLPAAWETKYRVYNPIQQAQSAEAVKLCERLMIYKAAEQEEERIRSNGEEGTPKHEALNNLLKRLTENAGATMFLAGVLALDTTEELRKLYIDHRIFSAEEEHRVYEIADYLEKETIDRKIGLRDFIYDKGSREMETDEILKVSSAQRKVKEPIYKVLDETGFFLEVNKRKVKTTTGEAAPEPSRKRAGATLAPPKPAFKRASPQRTPSPWWAGQPKLGQSRQINPETSSE